MAWSAFFRIRRVLYALNAFISFLGAIVLAIYIAKEWQHLSDPQRIMTVLAVGISAFTAVLLYLMIFVVFLVWHDLARVLVLLILHSGVAVMLMSVSRRLPCRPFISDALCNDMQLSFVIGPWTVAGIDAIYVLYFLVMLQAAGRPPKPRENISSDNRDHDRRISQASVDSATGLLQGNTQPSDYSSAESGLMKSALPEPEQTFTLAESSPRIPFGYEPKHPSPIAPYGTTGLQDVTFVSPQSTIQSGAGQGLSRSLSKVPASLRSGFSHGLPQRRANTYYVPPKPLTLTDPPGPVPQDPYRRADSIRSAASSRWAGARSRTYPSPVPPPNYPPQTPIPSNIASAFTYSALSGTAPHGTPVLKSAGAESRITVSSPHSAQSMVPSMHSVESAEISTYSVQTVPQSAYIRGDPNPPYPAYTRANARYAAPFPPMPVRPGARQFGSFSASSGGTYTTSPPPMPPRIQDSWSTSPQSAAVGDEQWKRLVRSAAAGRNTLYETY